MKFTGNYQFIIITSLILLFVNGIHTANLTCYQCTRTSDTECGHEDLKICPPGYDTCVTQFSKDDQHGFTLKRECGLGPCRFDDAMMNKGLGMDQCDRTRDQFFCIFCCPENGCNKSEAAIMTPPELLLSFTVILFSRFRILKNSQNY